MAMSQARTAPRMTTIDMRLRLVVDAEVGEARDFARDVGLRDRNSANIEHSKEPVTVTRKTAHKKAGFVPRGRLRRCSAGKLCS